MSYVTTLYHTIAYCTILHYTIVGLVLLYRIKVDHDISYTYR